MLVLPYDSLNRMAGSLTDDILMVYKGKTTYEYDSNGSLLSETTTQLATGQILTTDPATGLPLQPQVKSYSYNAFKQNISVTNADGPFQQNIYDALGLRISTIENGYRSDYIFDRGSIIAELDGSGTLTSMNIRGYGLLAQKDDKGRLNYYLHNAHGDVTSLIDASGKVLNSYTYDAFGNTMAYAETVANRFRYAGEQLDAITGQYYLRARFYDPTVGRFTQEDTYRGDGLNLYAYVGNNPVKYVDPSGHCKYEIKTAVNYHLLNNPNISEAAKKQIIDLISKGMDNSGPAFVAAPNPIPTNTGMITVNGKQYKIYVPGYDSSGSNANFTGDGWYTKETISFTSTKIDWVKVIAETSMEDIEGEGFPRFCEGQKSIRWDLLYNRHC